MLATQLNQRPAAGPVVGPREVAIATATGAVMALQKETGRLIGLPTLGPRGPSAQTPRLLASAASVDGATVYTLTVATGLPPTVTAFRRAAAVRP